MSGTSLTHYRITPSSAKGGMGEVYRAGDTRLGRDVPVINRLPRSSRSRRGPEFEIACSADPGDRFVAFQSLTPALPLQSAKLG